MLSGTLPINSTTPKICPFGYRRDAASGQCVKTISSVDRLMQQPSTPLSPTASYGSAPQVAPGVSDGLLPIYGTFGTIANTVLSVGVVLGAIGGILYIVKNKPFSRRKK